MLVAQIFLCQREMCNLDFIVSSVCVWHSAAGSSQHIFHIPGRGKRLIIREIHSGINYMILPGLIG